MAPGVLDDVAGCSWCGSRTYIERRLRTVEPQSSGVHVPIVGHDAGASAWSTDAATASCPGCGSALTTLHTEEIVRCPGCATFSKVERRQGPEHVGHAPEYPAPLARWKWQRARIARRDAARDAVIRRIIAAPELDERVELVAGLTPWEGLSGERELLFAELLGMATESPLLDRAVTGLVHRFLQMADQGGVGVAAHPWRYFVLRCARMVAFRPSASGRLVRELQYLRGGGAGLKLLLDIAAYALEADEVDYAVDAFEAIEVTIQSAFNWKHVDLMNDVVAYRLLYIDERLVAHLIHGVSWSWTIKPRVIARLVDDCVFERPDLVNTLANDAVSLPCARLDEYRKHLDFVRTLFTPVARGLALETSVYVPRATSPGLSPTDAEYVLNFLEAARDVPESRIVATRLLRWWVDGLAEFPPEELAGRIEVLRETLPLVPTWPVPKRPDAYSDHLAEIARRFDAGTGARSESEEEDPPGSTETDVRRRSILRARVITEESKRHSRNRDQERRGP